MLSAFLAHAALEAGETQAAEGRPALQLMTVHAAKGLEFHTVFLSGLEEGLFPHENSLSEHDGVEEERRLAYVAITRAKRRLYLTHAQSRMLHGQVRYNVASRFLDELPRALIQWLSPQRADVPPAREPASGAARYDALRDRPGWRIGQSVKHAKFGRRSLYFFCTISRLAAGRLAAGPLATLFSTLSKLRRSRACFRRFVGMKDVAVRDVVGDLERREEHEHVGEHETRCDDRPHTFTEQARYRRAGHR